MYSLGQLMISEVGSLMMTVLTTLVAGLTLLLAYGISVADPVLAIALAAVCYAAIKIVGHTIVAFSRP